MSDDNEINESKPLTKSADKTSKVKSADTKIEATSQSVKKSPEKKSKKSIDKIELKVKVVRDSFTMPQSDYVKLNELKLECLKAGLQVKKSELLRAGLHALCKLKTEQLAKAIEQIEQIKTGRPKKPEVTSKNS